MKAGDLVYDDPFASFAIVTHIDDREDLPVAVRGIRESDGLWTAPEKDLKPTTVSFGGLVVLW